MDDILSLRDATASLDLDVLINLGGLDSLQLAQAARLPVWTIDFDGCTGDGAALSAVAHGRVLTKARVVDVSEGATRVLLSGTFPTQRHSYVRQLDMLLLGTAGWFDRAARGRLVGDDAELSNPPTHRVAITRGEALRTVGAAARSRVRLHWKDATRRAQWNVGVVNRPVSSFVSGGVVSDVTWLRPPEPSGFVADPFAITVPGETWVFAEQVCFGVHGGRIVAMHVEADGRLGEPQVAMEDDIHLSYPYVFEVEGAIYCIPERSAAREVALYRAAVFPGQWEKVAVLLAGFSGSDSTIFWYDGRWWIFSMDSDARPAIELHAFLSQSLTGPWTPHGLNPLKTDVATARPAGTPFVLDGVLYRPTQDCTHTYGGAVSMNRVNELTPERFSEALVATVRPDPDGQYPEGLHTLSGLNEITILDGKRWLTTLPAPADCIGRFLFRRPDAR